MGDGLKRVAKLCGGLTATSGGKSVHYNADGIATGPANSDEAKILIRKLTKAQRSALDNMGANMHPRCATKTLDSLEKLGLIEGEDVTLPGRFPVKIRHHSVPVFVHIAWCDLCSEEITSSHASPSTCGMVSAVESKKLFLTVGRTLMSGMPSTTRATIFRLMSTTFLGFIR